MSEIDTHCGHGKLYTDDCAECDLVWLHHVSVPDARKVVSQLMRFYDAKSIIELLFSQDKHIEKLLAKLAKNWPPTVAPRNRC